MTSFFFTIFTSSSGRARSYNSPIHISPGDCADVIFCCVIPIFVVIVHLFMLSLRQYCWDFYDCAAFTAGSRAPNLRSYLILLRLACSRNVSSDGFETQPKV